jgi:hypothetical protein
MIGLAGSDQPERPATNQSERHSGYCVLLPTASNYTFLALGMTDISTLPGYLVLVPALDPNSDLRPSVSSDHLINPTQSPRVCVRV